MAVAGVLGHIVSRRLSQEYENVATEALVYVLRQSEAARHALEGLLRTAQPDLSAGLRFDLQEQIDEGRPDIVGRAVDAAVVFVEAKFWAGLTDAQPVRYLEALAKAGKPATLLFLVPQARVETVWRELMRRLEASAIDRADAGDVGASMKRASTTLGPTIALTSWPCLLERLCDALANAPAAKADVDQLRGLCVSAEESAFNPFSVEELSDQRVPMRVLQLVDLTESLCQAAGHAGIATFEGGLKAAHTARRSGRYVWLGKVGAFVGIDWRLWWLHGRTPIWVRFENSRYGQAPAVRQALEAWTNPRNRFVTEFEGQVAVGVDLPTGEERDAVVADLVRQLGELKDALALLSSEHPTWAGGNDLGP